MSSKEILAKMAHHVRNPRIVTKAEPRFPAEWHIFMGGSRASRREAALRMWEPFESRLPAFRGALDEFLEDVVCAAYDGEPAVLIYSFRVDSYHYLYQGGVPIVGLEPESGIVGNVREFYQTLHNGFGALVGWAGGLLPHALMFRLSSEEWGWLQDDSEWNTAPSDGRLDKRLAVFSNGAGNYIAIDVDNPPDDEGMCWMWFKDRAPNECEFWPALDAWMEICFQ